LAAERKMKHE